MSDNKALERAEIIAALRKCPVVECARCKFVGGGESGCDLPSLAADLLERDAKPPNEPLTCGGCVSFGEGSDRMPCFGCKRAVRKTDCYRRKPDGGGE